MTEAARLDLLGREPYYALIFCMEGTKEGGSLSRTTAIRTSDAYRLIASVAALSACAVNEGRIGPGIGFAAEVLEPDWAIERIRRSPAIDAFEVVDRERDDDPMDEGAI
jgi:saccharopine dehydrogenase